MGDRANIVIRDNWSGDLHDKEAVFLYSHWGGTELPDVLRQGLINGRGRWDDVSYLARILFDAMIGDSQGEETGYGISTRLTDNEYDLLVLSDQRVYVLKQSDYERRGFDALGDSPSIRFADYVAVERHWGNLTEHATEGRT